ncbi:high-potential iron-sulfur protein [Halomonas binhaiensis]
MNAAVASRKMLEMDEENLDMPPITRREFIRHGLLAITALPLGAGILSSRALAADLPLLDPSSPQAQALGYVDKAGKARGHDAWKKDRTCANCMFFDADSAGCQLFPQNRVAPEGWCQAWNG